jgi:hypothetical protein
MLAFEKMEGKETCLREDWYLKRDLIIISAVDI